MNASCFMIHTSAVLLIVILQMLGYVMNTG